MAARTGRRRQRDSFQTRWRKPMGEYGGYNDSGQSHPGVNGFEPRCEDSVMPTLSAAEAARDGNDARSMEGHKAAGDEAMTGGAGGEDAAHAVGHAGCNAGYAMDGGSAGPSLVSSSDRRIIKALAAVEETHSRLLQTASFVPEILLDSSLETLCESVELYGSLSLDLPDRGEQPPKRAWQQDWNSYYVTPHSDVDFVVEMKPGVSPNDVAQRLVEKGPWRLTSQVQVHKFGSTQYTLLGSLEKNLENKEDERTEVYLDITCIEKHLHFDRFKQRQEAFRRVFLDVRARMEAQYAAQGALAFDAYIHLLKAFAAKVPGNALTGFQATCIGLFTLMTGNFRMKPNQSIAPCLFEGFLRFCISFYQDSPRSQFHFRTMAIDLSGGGRWLPRMSSCWRSEVYFMAVEERMCTQLADRMNIAHSLEPSRVSIEAHALLTKTFCGAMDNWEQRPPAGVGVPVASPDSSVQ